jgi:hypothetical protein
MTRQLRELEVLEVCIGQGAIIPCFRCRIAFTMDDVKNKNIENEHLHEKKLGGPDEPGNRRFSHKAKPCHATVTHGNGATFAGSSRHKIKKATDPDRIEKFVVDKKPLALPPAVVDLGEKCRGCGEFKADCTCRIPDKRPAFQRAR